MTGQIGPEGLTRLVTLDKAAQQATLNALKLQNSSANRQADQALSSLLADLPQKNPPITAHPAEQTQKNRLP